MKHSHVVLIPSLAAALLSILPSYGEESWPRFRGENGSGVNAAKKIAEGFGERIVFDVSVPGSGQGSPVIFGDKVYLLAAMEEELDPPSSVEQGGKGKTKGKGKNKAGKAPKTYQWHTLAFDRNSGALIWDAAHEEGKFKGHRFNSAASSTAAVNEERVVFAWGTAERLTVVSLGHDGKKHWSADLGPVVGGHGFGGSPILYGDLVVLNNDQEKQSGNLIALDAATGEVAWTVDRRSERISYSVPCVYAIDGNEWLVFVNWQHGFTAIDPADGRVVDEKSVFYLETNERAISSPIVSQGIVIGTCGFTANPKHCVAMKMVEGKWEEIWRVERNVPHIPSVIAVDELTFLIDDSGIGTCVETLTGEEKWKERLPGVEGAIFGSPVSDGENILFVDESGNLHVIAAADKFASLGTYRLGEPCRTTPAIVDGTVYVRTETRLRAFR